MVVSHIYISWLAFSYELGLPDWLPAHYFVCQCGIVTFTRVILTGLLGPYTCTISPVNAWSMGL